MNVKSAFRKLLNDKFEQHGYKYLKEKQVFIKATDTGLVFSIGIRTLTSPAKGIKDFTYTCGMHSIYYGESDKSSFCDDDLDYYQLHKPELNHHYTQENFETVLLDTFEKAIENGIIPLFETIVDIPCYIDYMIERVPGRFSNIKLYRFGNDSLALIMTDNHDDFKDVLEMMYEVRYGKNWRD